MFDGVKSRDQAKKELEEVGRLQYTSIHYYPSIWLRFGNSACFCMPRGFVSCCVGYGPNSCWYTQKFHLHNIIVIYNKGHAWLLHSCTCTITTTPLTVIPKNKLKQEIIVACTKMFRLVLCAVVGQFISRWKDCKCTLKFTRTNVYLFSSLPIRMQSKQHLHVCINRQMSTIINMLLYIEESHGIILVK